MGTAVRASWPCAVGAEAAVLARLAEVTAESVRAMTKLRGILKDSNLPPDVLAMVEERRRVLSALREGLDDG